MTTPTLHPPQWTDADCVRSIELELRFFESAANLARELARTFDAAAAGTYPVSELPGVVRHTMQRMLDEAKRSAKHADINNGPMSATSHKA
ncbi:MAG: hypothetical protein KF764_10520 [Labilithrix sp.]|nr:hypothetical protein [Labilithrix sp.]